MGRGRLRREDLTATNQVLQLQAADRAGRRPAAASEVGRASRAPRWSLFPTPFPVGPNPAPRTVSPGRELLPLRPAPPLPLHLPGHFCFSKRSRSEFPSTRFSGLLCIYTSGFSQEKPRDTEARVSDLCHLTQASPAAATTFLRVAHARPSSWVYSTPRRVNRLSTPRLSRCELRRRQCGRAGVPGINMRSSNSGRCPLGERRGPTAEFAASVMEKPARCLQL